MKTYILSVLILISVATIAQEPYWQQELRYTIYATLNDKDNSITANETIVYKNNAPSSLDFIWFHLWPNAYKDESTALFQQIKNDESRSKKLKDPKYGYIDQLAFKVKGVAAKTEAHPKHIDICLLYTSDAADERSSVDLGGRRIIKKKKIKKKKKTSDVDE